MKAGLQVAQYRFVDRLAVGGMAEVFVAIAQGATGFEKPVVIKRLLPELGEDRRFHQMFLDEARIMASLQHGNIVQILDMGTLDGLPFLALEYVDGNDLRSVLDRGLDKKQQPPYPLVAYVASEVCGALDYAHRKQDDAGDPLDIVHRDVNPANVFISHEGQVKVGDFGLAQSSARVEHSEAGIIKGKISYLSPEQSEALKLDHRSDIFSLGTTLYEACCGRRPFVGSNESEIIERIRACRYVMPSRIRPDFPPRLEAVIAKAMQREPQRRYETAGQMRAALLRYLQHLPEPTDDRRLGEFLTQLFGQRQRTQSHLFRLPAVDALPPPMVSVPHPGPFPEYRHESGPIKAGTAAPPPVPSAAPVADGPSIPLIEEATWPELGVEGAVATAQDPTGPVKPQPSTPAQAEQPRARGGSKGGLWVGVILALLLALGVVAVLLYRVISPPTAELQLASTPSGATVTVDGVVSGQTPVRIGSLRLERAYEVRVTLAGYEAVSQRFSLREARVHPHSFDLAPSTQQLSVSSKPAGADVRVDGELRGQTPLTLRLRLGTKHAIAFEKTGHLSKTVQHRADQAEASLELTLEVELPAKITPKKTARRRGASRGRPRIPAGKGILELDVDEAAKVYIDGRYVGSTPGFRRPMKPGTYELRIVTKRSGVEHRGSTTISAGKIQRVHLTPPQ